MRIGGAQKLLVVGLLQRAINAAELHSFWFFRYYMWGGREPNAQSGPHQFKISMASFLLPNCVVLRNRDFAGVPGWQRK